MLQKIIELISLIRLLTKTSLLIKTYFESFQNGREDKLSLKIDSLALNSKNQYNH